MQEAPGLIARLHDVAMMSQPIKQRRGHLGIPKHAAPFAKGQIGRDHDAGVLIELGQ